MPKINTVIFDMDGLLIDSEPFWMKAANEAYATIGFTLSDQEYAIAMGMRTKEFTEFWLKEFKIDPEIAPTINDKIIQNVAENIEHHGIAMPGATDLVKACKENNFKIGIASSSPFRIIEIVIEKLQIKSYVDVITSAEELEYGKPHPQVFLECAKCLASTPDECLVFEDSFNGMIAAKAAKMFCIVVPDAKLQHELRWQAANIKLPSLQNFDFSLLKEI